MGRPRAIPTRTDRPAKAVTSSTRRLVLRWIGLVVFVVILGTVFVNLGEWQLDRLHQRRDRNAATIAAEQSAPVPYTAFFSTTRAIPDTDQWHRVTVTGTFDPDHSLVVRYRDNGSAKGYEIVTPLHTDQGATVLVDRGFIALRGDQQIPAEAPPPPSGRVSIVGHVRRDERGRTGAIRPDDGSVRLVNAPAIGATLPYPIVDGYVGVLTMKPADTVTFVPVQTPELSDGPHFWYAVQWFMFTGIGVLGVVVFIRSDLKERRAAQTARMGG